MKLIDKYLLRQFGVPLVYCLAAFCMIFVIFDLFEHLSDFIDAKTAVWQIVIYYACLLPTLLVYIAPISLLLALLYSLWQMTRHNELTAMRASGVGFFRLMVPLIVVGFIFSVLVSIVQETVAPWSGYRSEQFLVRQQKGNAWSTRYDADLPYKNERDHRIWAIRKFDLKHYDLYGINVIQQRPDGSDLAIIRAEKGQYLDGRWWLFQVMVQQLDHYNNPIGPVTYYLRLEMTDWDETPRDFYNEVKLNKMKVLAAGDLFLTATELYDFLKTRKTLSSANRARVTVDLHARLAMPWTCLIVMLFGIPCGVRTARKGALAGVLTALLTFGGFYMIMMISQWLGKSQLIEPWVSGWLPNVIFLLIGVFLMTRMR